MPSRVALQVSAGGKGENGKQEAIYVMFNIVIAKLCLNIYSTADAVLKRKREDCSPKGKHFS